MASERLTIKLEKMSFYCFHGLYPEERKNGGNYQVDLEVDYRVKDLAVYDVGTGRSVVNAADIMPINDLSETIDYAPLFNIVKEEMEQPRDLLETLAMSIAKRIAAAFPCQRILIEVKKSTVPLPDFTGHTAVRYEWQG